ncbi:MAG: BACON domain-containing protein [Bacteroidales bacterium]|nr:BACON domain-containing protein [Bacteroidales bacterium]
MKSRKLLFWAFAAVAMLAGCQEKPEDLGDPRIDLDQSTVQFSKEASEQAISFVATRAWSIKDLPGWLAAEPEKGEASANKQTVVLKALANTGNDRSAVVTVSCGIVKEYVTVNQAGEAGAAIKNDGSKEHPYLASEANAVALALADGQESSQAYYVKGFVKKFGSKHESGIKDFGNALFYITDDASGEGLDFYCYQVYYLGGQRFTSLDQINVGDEVIVYGKITNYGGTAETVGKGAAYIYSLNGETSGDDVGPGPITPITATNLLDNGSFEDWTADKPEGWDFEKGNAALAKSSDVKEGAVACEVCGDTNADDSKRENRRLMSKSYTLKPGTYQIQAYIKGEGQYRVGYAKLTNGKVAGSSDYIYLDSDPIQASSDWAQHTVQFTLAQQTSVSITFMNSKKGSGKSYLLDDVKLVTENGGLVDGSGDDGGTPVDYENAPAKTVSEFLAAADKNTYFKLSGTVSNFGSKYCSFDLTDETGTIYVYSVKNKDNWSSSIHEGGTVVLAGKYDYYEADSKAEVVDAYILSYDASTEIEVEGLEHPLTSSISWALGSKAYDNTSKGDSKQTATVNGTEVDNLLKLGTSSAAGDATFTIPAGVTKIGMYVVGWDSGELSVGDQKITFKKNAGCAGNAPYEITLSDEDYYEVSVPEGQVKVSCPSRVLMIGINSAE